MKIIVLSDSHGYIAHMDNILLLEKPDYVIHLGDHARDAEELRSANPMLPIASIKGNCDFDPIGTDQILADYGGVRIMAVHGHRYGVKSGLLRYTLAAKENQADVALFGHTHQPYCEQYENIWLLNPGSCGYCAGPTYGLIEITNGTAACTIKAAESRG